MTDDDELAQTRVWYERAAWLSAGVYQDDAELTECVAELRTRVHRLERVADDMAAGLREQRDVINQMIDAVKGAAQ